MHSPSQECSTTSTGSSSRLSTLTVEAGIAKHEWIAEDSVNFMPQLSYKTRPAKSVESTDLLPTAFIESVKNMGSNYWSKVPIQRPKSQTSALYVTQHALGVRSRQQALLVTNRGSLEFASSCESSSSLGRLTRRPPRRHIVLRGSSWHAWRTSHAVPYGAVL